jgi:hypothetical protein
VIATPQTNSNVASPEPRLGAIDPRRLRPGSPSGVGREIELQGYIGQRPIRAIFGAVLESEPDNQTTPRLRGRYRVVGEQQDVSLEPQALDVSSVTQADAPAEEQPSPLSEPSAGAANCSFDEARDGNHTGTIEALCTLKDDNLTVEGTWSPESGGASEPMFLGTIPGSAELLDDYLPSILAASKSKHRCAPYVRIGTAAASAVAHRTWYSYVLHWPCDESRSDVSASGLSSAQATRSSAAATSRAAAPDAAGPRVVAPAPTMLGMLGEFHEEAPYRLFGRPMNFGSLDADTALHVQALEASLLDARLYLVDVQTTSEAGPGAVHCCWTSSMTEYWLFAMTPDGKTGPLLKLPQCSASSGLGCFDTSTTVQLTAVDLDGKAPPELLVTKIVNSNEQREAPPGSPPGVWSVCVARPEERTHEAYRYDPSLRRFQSVKLASPALAETSMKVGREITFMTFSQ